MFSFLIVLSLFIAPTMAQASDSCFGKSCETPIPASKDTISKSQSDTNKPVKADHCCACGGCHIVFHASFTGSNSIEQPQEKPLLKTAFLSGLGPQSLLEPPRII